MAATKFNVPLRGNVILTTTTADLQELVTFQTKPNSAYQVEIKAVYRRNQGDGQLGAYWRRAAFRTNADGTLTQVSTTQTPAADIEDEAGAQFLVDANGTEIRVRGAAEGSPVYWAITSDINVVDNVPVT